jgi:hypothetical protein
MSFVDLVHNSAYAAHIRESQYIYPLLQCVHITGIGMFAGGITLINLRLAGLGGAVPAVDFTRHAMRIAWLGLVLIVLTGLNMAGSFAQVFAVSTVMQAKLGVIVLALANAVIIQRGISGGSAARWAASPPDAKAARKWAALGITALVVIITLGKLLAYIGGKD